MSTATRQHTCAVCGSPFLPQDRIDLEPLIDGAIRYIAVHAEHSTFAPPRLQHRTGRPTAGTTHAERASRQAA